MDDTAKAAMQIGYAPADIATFMDQRECQPEEIAAVLAGEANLDAAALANIIVPFVKGETVAARAEETIKVVKEALSEYEEDDLLPIPANLGCSPEEAAAIIHRNTDWPLGTVLVKLKLYATPNIAAKIAADADVDLSEEEEYNALRDGDDGAEFGAAAAILKACGKDAETILAAEDAYEEFDANTLDAIFPALSAAGFTNAEIMTGISESSILDENTYSTIIQTALDGKVPAKDIVAFLRQANADPEDLDEEMRDVDFGIRLRIDILHTLLHADDGEPAPGEPATQEIAEPKS
jgi:hypothetical protein